MANTCIIAESFDRLPEPSRRRLRAFLDASDSANPYQDPAFFGGRSPREVDLLIEREGRPVFFALCFENTATRILPWLRSLVVHKGPVADDLSALKCGLQALQEFGRKNRLCEIHINPQITEDKTGEVIEMCDAIGFFPLVATTPTMTLRLDITCDPGQLLARFRKGTRYEVRRAERIGITVRRAETEADFLTFYQLHNKHSGRKGFAALPIEEFTALSKRIQLAPGRAAIFLSEYRGDILAGAVVLRAGLRVHYLYGGTDADSAGSLPSAYPILVRAIAWAKEIGCTEFDFGGYGSSGVPSVRRFKEGFGGEVRTFGPTYTLTLVPLVSRLRQLMKPIRS